MNLTIDTRSPLPVYQQVIQAIKLEVLAGRLRDGDSLPSIRDLAKLLKINPNTVVRAYRDLEQEGIIFPKQGIGNLVIASADTVRQSLIEEMAAELFMTMAKLKKTGILFQEFAKVVEKVWESI